MFKNKPLMMTNNKCEAKTHNITDDYEISNTVLGMYFYSMEFHQVYASSKLQKNLILCKCFSYTNKL